MRDGLLQSRVVGIGYDAGADSSEAAATETDDVFSISSETSSTADDLSTIAAINSDVLSRYRHKLTADQTVNDVMRDYYAPDAPEAAKTEPADTKKPYQKPLIAQALLPKNRRKSSSQTSSQTPGTTAELQSTLLYSPGQINPVQTLQQQRIEAFPVVSSSVAFREESRVVQIRSRCGRRCRQKRQIVVRPLQTSTKQNSAKNDRERNGTRNGSASYG